MVTIFGLVFLGLAALVVLVGIVIPSVIPKDFPLLGVAFVLTVMGAIGGFPEQYMKIFDPRLRNITGELQSHLSQIAVESYIIDRKGPEAVKHRDKLWLPTGIVRIKDRNIALLESRARLVPDEGIAVQYVCIVRGEVREETVFHASTDGGEIWSGGRLADVLNRDNELRTMLTGMTTFSITVRGIRSDSCVMIHGLSDYPSVDEFNAFDRIAGHVKEALRA